MQRSEGYEQHKRLTCNDYDKKKKKKNSLFANRRSIYSLIPWWYEYVQMHNAVSVTFPLKKKKKREKLYRDKIITVENIGQMQLKYI